MPAKTTSPWVRGSPCQCRGERRGRHPAPHARRCSCCAATTTAYYCGGSRARARPCSLTAPRLESRWTLSGGQRAPATPMRRQRLRPPLLSRTRGGGSSRAHAWSADAALATRRWRCGNPAAHVGPVSRLLGSGSDPAVRGRWPWVGRAVTRAWGLRRLRRWRGPRLLESNHDGGGAGARATRAKRYVSGGAEAGAFLEEVRACGRMKLVSSISSLAERERRCSVTLARRR